MDEIAHEIVFGYIFKLTQSCTAYTKGNKCMLLTQLCTFGGRIYISLLYLSTVKSRKSTIYLRF